MTNLSKICDKLIEWGIIISVIITPLFFSFSALNNFTLPKVAIFRSLVALMLLFWIIKSIEEKKITFNKSALPIAVLIFLAINIFSTITSINPEISFWGTHDRMEGLFTFLHLIIFFLLAASFIKRKGQTKKIIKAMVLASVPIAIHAILQHYNIDFFKSISHVGKRSYSTLGNALHLGAYLVFVIPFTLFLILEKSKKLKVWNYKIPLLVLILALQILALLFTQTRSAWLAILISMLFFSFLWAIKQKSKKGGLALAIIIALIVLVSVSLFSSNNFLNLPKENKYLKRVASAFDLENVSNAQRILVWENTLEIIKKRPFLGYGPEMFAYALSKNYPPELTKFPEPYFDRAHNHFLDMGINTGFLGIISFLSIIFLFYFYQLKIFRKSQDQTWQLFSISASTAVLAYLIQNQFSFNSPVILVYFYLFLGITASVDKFLAEEEQSKNQEIIKSKKILEFIYYILGIGIIILIFWLNFLPYRADTLFRKTLSIRDWSEREKLYDRLIPISPYKNYYRYQLAGDYFKLSKQILKELNNKVKAEKYLNLAIDNAELNIKNNKLDYENYLDLGNFYTFYGKNFDPSKFDLANKAYLKASQISPTRQSIYWQWGDSLLEQEKIEQAIEKYRQAIDLHPQIYKSWEKISDVYKKLNKEKQAQEALEKAKELKLKN